MTRSVTLAREVEGALRRGDDGAARQDLELLERQGHEEGEALTRALEERMGA